MRVHLARVLFVAAFIVTLPALTAVADEAAIPTLPTELTTDLSQKAIDGSCDTSIEAPGEQAFDQEALGDASHGAENRAVCWYESKSTYSCTCLNNTRVRRHSYERFCCQSSGCGSWQATGTSCTGNLCGP